ncbi:MAG: NAD-dependent epimerase/dehydratase family protein [Halodesulfurarchaeum sp.]|nr:NAD-dependent epimerase/dehydratase family protein [Halodesulfurarchaeum sp.]
MRVLVTGGTGYIGTNLLSRFPEKYEPVTLVRDSSREELLPDGVETVHGDVTDKDSLASAMVDIDAVVHMAAVNPGSRNSPEITSTVSDEVFRRVNVEGTENVLATAADAGVESVVYLSTTKAHPAIEAEDPSMYVKTKGKGGDLLESGEYPFKYSIVHPTYVMGQRDFRLKRYEPFRLAASNALLVPPMYTPGRINIVHVNTIADSILYYLENPTDNHHMVSGPNINRKAFAKELASLSDHRTVVFNIPFRKKLLPLGVKTIDATGITNVDADRLVLDAETGTVPPVQESRAPVPGKSWQEAVRDTWGWYKLVGLL